jgi:cyclic pyranopterin phosphate synthase
MAKLSHYDRRGRIRMVDVSTKPVTAREATAQAIVRMRPATLRAVRRLETPKGDPFEVARIAGIAAAKRTAEWIPLCHPLPLTHVDVRARLRNNGVELTARVAATAPTGVEMEALVAVVAAALTLYDMCKALDKGIVIGPIRLLEKTGGKSGAWRRAGAAKSRARAARPKRRRRSRR